MRKALEAGAGLGRVWAGLASARADGAAAHRRRERAGAAGVRYRLHQQVEKEERVGEVLTETKRAWGGRAGGSGGEDRRRAGAELGGGAGTGVLRALDLPEEVREGPARVVQS